MIGLEIHAELKTKTKMFCDSLNDPDEKHPNINVCPICMGHPGCLPVTNEDAVKKVIMAGLALGCKIEKDTFFERKNYFYPDLPKGYQISQYQKPLCYNGYLDLRPTSDVLRTSDVKVPLGGTSQIGKRIRITRIHLEEDAGRLYHLPGDPDASVGASYSLVDFNRAGVPLMELVTEPDLESGQEVRKFAEELQLIWRYLGVSDADMEKGQMRVEVNISLTNSDGSWGTKVEVKNINSIKFAADAVDYEIKRQTEILSKGRGEEFGILSEVRYWDDKNKETKTISSYNTETLNPDDFDLNISTPDYAESVTNTERPKQETRGWDENKKATFSQRSKEEAHDYRYFPEPDLPPIRIADGRASPALSERGGPPTTEIFIDDIKTLIPELPQQRRERFAKQYGLPERDIELFTTNRSLGNYFEQVASELLSFDKLDHLKKPEAEHQSKLFKLASNYIITELKRMAEEVYAEPSDTKVSPEMLADLVVRIFHGEVSSSGAQAVLKEMFATGATPEKVIEEKDLAQLSNVGDLEMAVDKVVADNSKAVEDYKKGKKASLKFLIGMVVKETRGRANPQIVEELLKKSLH